MGNVQSLESILSKHRHKLFALNELYLLMAGKNSKVCEFQMSLTFSPFVMGGLEGRRGEELQKNFTLVFHLKSDWKWDLLFRSSSCASSLSQVEKKTKKMKPSTQLD